MAPSSSQALLSPGIFSTGSQTVTPSSENKMFSWQRPKLVRNGVTGGSSSHRVTFSGSSKGSLKSRDGHRSDHEYQSSHSSSSRAPSPAHPNSTASEPQKQEPWTTLPDQHTQIWQKIDRQTEAAWQEPQMSPVPEQRPFLVYNDSFLSLMGATPILECLIHDTRGPYFFNSGIYSSKSSTLFISSSPVPDSSPSAAPSRNQAMTITKIEFHSPSDYSRDKVRTPEHSYMPKSGCAWNSGIVWCAQGTLSEPASLIFMESRRPHKSRPLLTNFNGVPLNSPHTCVLHADGSIWFSDPHLSHTPSFRPKPRLPSLIYRFDPLTSDLRAMCDEIACPTEIAFSPDYKTFYVLNLPQQPPQASSQSNGAATNGHGGQPQSSSTASSLLPSPANTPMIYAFTVSGFGSNKAPFLTHRRLFAFTTVKPSCIFVDIQGHVFVGCVDGIHVFDEGGTLIGRILVEGGVTGLCFGRAGEIWASGGDRIWRVQLDKGLKGAALTTVR